MSLRIALLGATGLVGREMMRIMESRGLGLDLFRPLGSSRSAGSKVFFSGRDWTVEEVFDDSFEDIDIALFSAGGDVSRKWAPVAAGKGAVVIDNSSAWRMDDGVPLVVPEINPQEILRRPKGIIANPNCSTIHGVMALYPLHAAAGLLEFVVTTFQSVSGSGWRGLQELDKESRLALDGKAKEAESLVSSYPKVIAFNVIPQIGSFSSGDFTDEEWKMVRESRKILALPDLKVDCTCARVPVMMGHSLSLSARFEKPISPDEAREILSKSPGISLLDGSGPFVYPTPLDISGLDDVFIGRIRRSMVFKNGLDLWVCSDNIRKGAALNAVQIAELLIR